MTPAEIRRAANVLRREARAIKSANAIGGRWGPRLDGIDDCVRSDHDEMLDLAAKLTAHAKAIAGAERGRG